MIGVWFCQPARLGRVGWHPVAATPRRPRVNAPPPATKQFAITIQRRGRRGHTSGPFTIIRSNLTSLAFTNTGLANGTIYYYVVSALNAAGESANSIEAGARPVSLAPPQLASVAGANELQFTLPQEHTGWRLEAQTNSIGAGLGTNRVTVSGSTGTNQLSVPISTANGSVFFRLVYP